MIRMCFAALLRLACLVAIFGCHSVANAQLLDYGPYKGYGLGKGILGNDYSEPKSACIVGDKNPLPASQTHIYVSIVFNADEYKQAFHIDQHAEASFLGLGGGGEELHFGQERTGSSSAFDIILEANSESDGQTLDNIDWNPKYKSLMDSQDPAKIARVREDCGDRYIQTVFNQARLFAVLHVSNQQNSTLTTFVGKMSGKIDLDIVSANSSLGGDANFRNANKSGAITADIYSEGIGGLSPTASALGIVPKSDDGLEAIASKLSTYLAGLKVSGQPVKYKLSPLPGLVHGDLTDQRIFSYLWEMKSKYSESFYRLQNVKSLLNMSDPRRILYRQPAADNLLKTQNVALEDFVDALAVAHKECRMATTVQVCRTKADILKSAPTLMTIELPPIYQPFVVYYFFAIDGIPVAAGQNPDFIAGPTIMDAARRIKPDASNVDFIAAINASDYVASVDLLAVTPVPDPAPYNIQTIGVKRLNASDLSWPPYWKDERKPILALRVMHADKGHPCKIEKSNGGLNVVEEDCLTPYGRSLRNIALIAASGFALNRKPRTYSIGVLATANDCLAHSSSIVIAQFSLDYPTDKTVRFISWLNMPGGWTVPLIQSEEGHTASEWRDLAAARLDEFKNSRSGSTSVDPCGPRFP